MKTMKKKAWLFVAFTAALIIVALVVSCINPVTGLPFLSGDSSPEGTGGIRISFGDNAARTLYPDYDAYKVLSTANYAAFGLEFASGGGTYYVANDGTGTVSVSGVPNGTYTLTVTAYKTAPTGAMTDINPPTVPILSGQATSVAISSVTSASASVTLKLITTGANGTFSYTIGNGVTGLDTANLQIRSDLTAAPAAGPLNVTLDEEAASWSNTTGVSLAPGYYYAYLTLTKGAVTKVFIELIRIYQNMDTPWTGLTVASGYFPGTSGGGEFNLTVGESKESTPLDYDILPSTGTISKTSAGGNPNVLTVTVKNADAYTTMTWLAGPIGNEDVSASVAEVTPGDPDVLRLTLNAATLDVGTYNVFVEGDDGEGRNSISFAFRVID
jgi:hypothetical protein